MWPLLSDFCLAWWCHFIHVVACFSLYSFTELTNAPLRGYATFCLPISWWTFGLFPHFGLCKSCCFKYSCITFLWTDVFLSLGKIHSSALAGSYGNSVFNFWPWFSRTWPAMILSLQGRLRLGLEVWQVRGREHWRPNRGLSVLTSLLWLPTLGIRDFRKNKQIHGLHF